MILAYCRDGSAIVISTEEEAAILLPAADTCCCCATGGGSFTLLDLEILVATVESPVLLLLVSTEERGNILTTDATEHKADIAMLRPTTRFPPFLSLALDSSARARPVTPLPSLCPFGLRA